MPKTTHQIRREVDEALRADPRPARAHGGRLVDLDPDRIWPWNEAFDTRRVERIRDSMESGGWSGRPLVVVRAYDGRVADGRYQALTGSHRLAAATEAGLESVPCVVVDLPPGWRATPEGLHRGRHHVSDADEALEKLEIDGLDREALALLGQD